MLDYESRGRGFESLRVHQKRTGLFFTKVKSNPALCIGSLFKISQARPNNLSRIAVSFAKAGTFLGGLTHGNLKPLICNQTHYFDYDESGYAKSKEALSRFLPGYLEHNPLSQAEIDAFFDLIALYHFALQATIIEMYGLACVDNAFLDKQLDWLNKWWEQCESEAEI